MNSDMCWSPMALRASDSPAKGRYLSHGCGATRTVLTDVLSRTFSRSVVRPEPGTPTTEIAEAGVSTLRTISYRSSVPPGRGGGMTRSRRLGRFGVLLRTFRVVGIRGTPYTQFGCCE